MPSPSCEAPTGEARPIATPKRKSGRPLTTGEYVGVAEAKKAANDEVERSLRLQVEVKLAEELETWEAQLRSIEVDDMEANPTTDSWAEVQDRSTVGLTRAANAHLGKIYTVARKSKNLKGSRAPLPRTRWTP